MILLHSKEINTFCEILKKYDELINLPYLECPNCKSNNLIRHSKYKRNAYYIEDNEIKHKIINIIRVKCKECKRTHALLPICIIPYKHNILDVIVKSLVNDQTTINISIDTINKWNKELNIFLPYLKTFFNNISKAEILNKIINDIYVFYESFYIRYQKILMMVRSGTKNICHF